MAITQLLTVGTTAADSADVVVASGSTLTVALNDADATLVDPTAIIHVSLKDPSGLYFRQFSLDANNASMVIAAGTWRFSRPASSPSVGVFSA